MTASGRTLSFRHHEARAKPWKASVVALLSLLLADQFEARHSPRVFGLGAPSSAMLPAGSSRHSRNLSSTSALRDLVALPFEVCALCVAALLQSPELKCVQPLPLGHRLSDI